MGNTLLFSQGKFYVCAYADNARLMRALDSLIKIDRDIVASRVASRSVVRVFFLFFSRTDLGRKKGDGRVRYTSRKNVGL